MYVHIGWNQVINVDDIIAIINSKEISKRKSPLHYYANKKKIIVNPDEPAKTYIITENFVYITSISSQTIKKRIKMKLL